MAPLLLVTLYALSALAQSISTSQASPPLQWINLGSFASGTAPSPVKDAILGYDSTSQKLLIFGGTSSYGLPTGETTLFDMKTLSWGVPASPAGLTSTPPARSLAIAGGDYAASYRSALTMYGGLGNSGPLDDFWSFDYISQFWSQGTINDSVPTPGPRYGASGGVDPTKSMTSQQLTTTMIMVGGSNGTTGYNDAWELLVTGTLSSNNVNMTVGTWNKLSPGNLPASPSPKMGQANMVLAQSTLVIVGGCNETASALNNATCAQPVMNSLQFASGNPANAPGWTTATAACAGARYGATLAPNMNPASTSFSTQAFMMFGALDPVQWDDQNGTYQGEVDILDAVSGTWSRILPSHGGTFPSARYGAVAVSSSSVMTGPTDTAASDTVIFGGVDVATGNYLNEIWLLRQYNAAVVGSTGNSWSGFGDGQLVDNVNSTGTGVTNTYMTQCAAYTPLPASTSSGSSSSPTSTSPTPSSSSSTSTFYPFDVASSHKVLSAVSVAVFLPCLLVLRSTSGPIAGRREYSLAFIYLASMFALLAYAVGIAGFAMALTTTYRVPVPLMTRAASSTFLQTAHGQAGLALFICLYVLVPAWAGIMHCLRRNQSSTSIRPDSVDIMEKTKDSTTTSNTNFTDIQKRYTDANRDEVSPPTAAETDTRKVRRISQPTVVTNKLSDWVGHRGRRLSESALSTTPSSSHTTTPQEGPNASPRSGTSFEVTNRPRRISGPPGRLMPNDHARGHRRPMQSLNDVSWLERRGHIGGVAELDLAITAANATSQNSHTDHTPQLSQSDYFNSPDPLIHSSPTSPGHVPPTLNRFPRPPTVIFRAFLFAILTFACILTLVALRQRGPVWAFAVFLVWTLLFYALVLALAWYGRPRPSSLAVILARIREDGHPPSHAPVPVQSPDMARSPSTRPPSRVGLGPYTYHQPPYHRANSHEEDARSGSGYPMSIESGDEDEDDELRQRQMEAEMESRDVVVMTVPRRQLKIVNV